MERVILGASLTTILHQSKHNNNNNNINKNVDNQELSVEIWAAALGIGKRLVLFGEEGALEIFLKHALPPGETPPLEVRTFDFLVGRVALRFRETFVASACGIYFRIFGDNCLA